MGSVLTFLKTHKWKILLFTVVGAGGAGFVAYRLLMGMKEQLQEQLKKHQIATQKQRDLERLKSECSETVTSFTPPLRKQLHKLTDPRAVTMQLKDMRAKAKKGDKVDEVAMNLLWDDLKVFSMSRLIGSVYALVLMDLLLRVQLHVANKTAVEERGKVPITLQVRKEFMFKATDFFVNHGLKNLMDRVSAGVRTASKKWNMGSEARVSRQEIIDMIQAIRSEIEQTSHTGRISSSAHQLFLSCLIQPDEVLARAKKDAGFVGVEAEGLKNVLDETMDLLESPHFVAVLEEALTVVFNALLEDLAARQFEIKKSVVTVASTTSTGGEPSSTTSTAHVSVDVTSTSVEEKFVLAKVIVGMNASDVLCGDKDDGSTELTLSGQTLVPVESASSKYVKLIEGLSSLQELSKAILGIEDSATGMDGAASLENDPMQMMLSSLLSGGAGGPGGGGGGGGPGGLPPQLMQQLGMMPPPAPLTAPQQQGGA